MNSFLKFLANRTPSVWVRYGVVLALLVLITLFRLVVALDTAPFLLYLPVIFLMAVALGRGPGVVGTIFSAALAASFFQHSSPGWWQITTNQSIALVEYLLVDIAMVEVCVALRRVILDNEIALERLQASETTLRTIVETMPIGIMFAEAPTGRIVGRNKRIDDIVGVPSGQPKTLGEYGRWTAFHGDGRQVEAHEFPLARVMKQQVEEASLEVQYQRRDGSRVWVDLLAAATRNSAGDLTGAVCAISDIETRKKAEAEQARMTGQLAQRTEEAEAAREAAEGANRAKSAFLANMSHELRTPLSAVIGYTELLEEEAQESGESAMLTDLGKIKSNAKHLLSLINDVLDLSKVEANKMDVATEDIEVEIFARDAVTTVEALARTKANTLSLEVVGDLGSMHSDVVKLRQCLFNLLSNACKFTENGTITMRAFRTAEADGDWLSFAVTDTGIGMTPEQLQRLFQRFMQADETTTRKFGGTGLGLALSRAFAKLLGGDISVTSTLGEGTCFTLKVPAIAPRQNADFLDPNGGEHAAARPGQELVLVIDDEASQRDLLARFLFKQNFAVHTASDGTGGLELARTLKPRVILLDIMMPDMDGWSVLKTLKSTAATADIPVILVSFLAEPGLSTAMGAAAAVTKPIDWAKLKRLLDQFRTSGGDVLVVDDDPDTRDRLRAVLQKNGWSVQEAGDGAEALERVMIAPPTMIVLDLTMPMMDGFSFLDRLREIPGSDAIPVVVLSARDITAAERARLTEVERVLRKDETSMRDLTAELRAIEGSRTPSTNPPMDAA